MITVIGAQRNNPSSIKTLRVIFCFFSLSLCLSLPLCVCLHACACVCAGMARDQPCFLETETISDPILSRLLRLALSPKNLPASSSWVQVYYCTCLFTWVTGLELISLCLYGGSSLAELTSLYCMTLSFLTNSELSTKRNATATTENWIEGYTVNRQEIAFRNFSVGNTYFTYYTVFGKMFACAIWFDENVPWCSCVKDLLPVGVCYLERWTLQWATHCGRSLGP